MRRIMKRKGQSLDPFDSLRRQMDRAFGEFFDSGNDASLFKSDFYPKVDLEEKKNRIVVKVEIPGVPKEDIDVSIKDNILTIKGEKKEEHEEGEKGKSYIKESVYGSFERSFRLPDVDAEKIQAKFKDGVLKIELPKVKESELRSKIEVK